MPSAEEGQNDKSRSLGKYLLGCNRNQSQFFDLAHGAALPAGGLLNWGVASDEEESTVGDGNWPGIGHVRAK